MNLKGANLGPGTVDRLGEGRVELTRIWEVGEEKSGIIRSGGFDGQNATNVHKRIQAAGISTYLRTSGKSKTQIARDLGISDSALNK
jgi:hypothetical protein